MNLMIETSMSTRRKSTSTILMKKSKLTLGWITVASALVMAGCGSSTPTTVPQTAPATPASGATVSASDLPDITKYAEAGVPVKTVPVATMQLATMTAGKYGPARSDPFALEPSERQYDTEQETERVFGDIGGWQNSFEPSSPFPPEVPNLPTAQPYRRLSGVVVGDSIVALISMEDGSSYIIHPGQQLPAPYSEWTIKSIDMDQAVLSRQTGNPREVVVRLELPPGGGAPSGSAGPPGGFGGPGPGGPPPGFGGGGPGSGRPPGGRFGGPPGFGGGK